MPPALRISSLEKRFGATRAVKDVSLQVATGSIYGLLGPNGSGKTTTLGCALGLQRPDRGEIEVLGVPAAALHRTRGRVGVVFDDPTLLTGMRALDNLEYARRLLGHTGGRSPREALERVGLGDRARARAGTLSLGQKRRLSIARALLGRPELLVLDEPLSGLDTPGVRDVLELLRELHAEGLTLLLSSHRLHELERIVTHVGVLMGGELVREGTLDELLESGGRRLAVRAAPGPLMKQVLDSLTPDLAWRPVAPGEELEARLPRGEPGDDTALALVEPGRLSAAEINHKLHQGGCKVSALVPQRLDLQTVFENLLDAALDGRAADRPAASARPARGADDAGDADRAAAAEASAG